MMKENIIKLLKDLEVQKNIKILFAVESGSRAWGLESKNSDYDVRFVYSQPVEEYLQINQPEEVITAHFDESFKHCAQEGCFIDISGFDIFKFCEMLWKSNPTCIEWLCSEIVYIGEKPEEFMSFSENEFNPTALYYHFKSMCAQNYEKHLKSGNLVTYKKYLYAMRGLTNAKWVAAYKTLPLINFPETLKILKKEGKVDGLIIDELEDIIKLKKSCAESKIIPRRFRFEEYIERCLKDNSDAPEPRSPTSQAEINAVLRRVVKNGYKS